MDRHERLLQTVLGRQSDANIRFSELRALLFHLGFSERVRGSHHIFHKQGTIEIINIQSRGDQAKPFQVRQVGTSF